MITRLKFEIAPLVDEMLDQADPKVFESSSSTFMDPAMAGGQFIFKIIERLKKNGHSDENIKARVFGFEDNILYVDYVAQKYFMEHGVEIPATLEVGGLKELQEVDMQFDLVATNPPYQHQSNSKGNKMWHRFIKGVSELVAPNGYLCMITPTSWVKGGNNIGKWGVLNSLFAEKQLIVADMINANQHFPGIGVDIGWWVMRNQTVSSASKFILNDGEFQTVISEETILSPNHNMKSNSIIDKVLSGTQKRVQVKSFNNKGITDGESETMTEDFKSPHWVMGSDKTGDLCIRYKKNFSRSDLSFRKIVFPIQSRYWNPYFDGDGIGVMSQGFAISLDDGDTKEGAYSVFYSKLFRYICFNLQLLQNGFMKTSMVRKLPKLDLTRTWTEAEIYAHFNLTEEEIDYIEEQVK